MPATQSYPTGFSPEQRKAYKDLADDYYEELTSIYGIVMHQQDYMKSRKISRETARKELQNVPYITSGKLKKYRTLDIARMLAMAQVGVNIETQSSNISSPSIICQMFISACKKLKMNKCEIVRASELIINYLKEGKTT